MYKKTVSRDVTIENITIQSLYVVMCVKIGSTQKQLATRKDIIDTKELVDRKVTEGGIVFDIIILSGSKKEGFRLNESDVDVMYWGSDFRVIWYFSQAVLYNTQRHTLFLCDSSQSPPGYTLLWVPTDSAYPFSSSFFVRVKGIPCISSAKLSDYLCTHLHPSLRITMHGPCSNVITGTKEYDFVSNFQWLSVTFGLQLHSMD